MSKNGYQADRDTWVIHGVEYSDHLFKSWSKNGIPIGTIFELIERDENGVITLKEIESTAMLRKIT